MKKNINNKKNNFSINNLYEVEKFLCDLKKLINIKKIYKILNKYK